MPPGTGDAAQPGQQRVGRAPHMQDHRQAGVARQLQLREVEVLLARGPARARSGRGRSRPPPPGAGRRGARPAPAQPVEVGVGGAVDVQRVDAQRIGQAVRWASVAHGSKCATSTAGSTCWRTPAARARGTTVAVGVELRRVEVAVRVDPHGRR
jgi:hypothetical protein